MEELNPENGEEDIFDPAVDEDYDVVMSYVATEKDFL